MKNESIVESWGKIQPSAESSARMKDAILTYNQSAPSKIRRPKRRLVRFAPIAACLIIAIAAAVPLLGETGMFGPPTYSEPLEGGTLHFYKTGVSGYASLDFGVKVYGRSLTAEENDALFPGFGYVSYGLFNTEGGQLLHVEGKSGKTKIIASAPGLPTADWTLSGAVRESTIGGVAIEAGYFVTDKNSVGEQNIIFYASFTLNGHPMYVERGGSLHDREAMQQEIAGVINALIQYGGPDLDSVSG